MITTESPIVKPANFDFPATVVVDTTSYCNLKCSMCPHVIMTRKKGRMEWGLFKKIIDEIALTNPHSRVWLVFFGEPLILKKTKPSIFDMIRYCKEKGLTDVALNSNGNLLDKESSEKLLDAGLDELYIGIDAFSTETYEKLRVGGKYDRTVKNVLGFLDALNSRGIVNYPIQVQFIEMDRNKHEKKQFVKFWLSKGVSVKIRKKVTWAGLIKGERKFQAKKRHKCYWAINTLCITDKGDVPICPADPDAHYIMGNLYQESIKDIWTRKLGQFRALHENGLWDELPAPCSYCTDWQVSYKDILINKNIGSKKILFGFISKPINYVLKKLC